MNNISHKALANNFFEVIVDGKIYYFSYDTLVGFWSVNNGLQVCENVWSKTTGKHINMLQPNQKKRVKYADFEKMTESL